MKIRILAAFAAVCVLPGIVHADDNLRGRTIASACFGCHGASGMSGAAIPPIIIGAPAQYIEGALKAFREGSRPATIMDRIAKGYSDEDITAVAEYFSALGGS